MCSFVLFLVRFSLFFLCFFECFLVILLVVFLCLSSVLFSVHFFVLVPFPFYIHFPLVVVLFLPCFLGVFFVLVIVLLFVLFFLHFRVFFRALSGTQDKQPEYFAFWPLLFLVVTSEDQDMHNLYNMPGPTQPEQSTATNILDHICSDLIFSEPIWSDPSSQILEWRRTFHHSFCSKQLQKKTIDLCGGTAVHSEFVDDWYHWYRWSTKSKATKWTWATSSTIAQWLACSMVPTWAVY